MPTRELSADRQVVERIPAVALIHQEADFTKTSGGDDTKENAANRTSQRSYVMLLLGMAIMTTVVICG
jgi:hypothetical protein